MIIETTDERLTHNPNGTWWCQDCHMVLVLFDDDQHDCTGRPWWLGEGES